MKNFTTSTKQKTLKTQSKFSIKLNHPHKKAPTIASGLLMLLIFSLTFSALGPYISTSAQEISNQTEPTAFRVEGTKIIDPNGEEFIVRGINARGTGRDYIGATYWNAPLIADVWQFNTVRLYGSMGWGWEDYNKADLDTLIDAFTSRGVVVMLELHDWTGVWPTEEGYWRGEIDRWDDYVPSFSEMLTWWVDKANRFGNNSYVWFNVINEPGIDNSEESALKWLNIHDILIGAIRATGAKNLIVLNDHNWGQANSYYGGSTSFDSAIIRMGPILNERYDNLVFSLHVYDAWANGQTRLENYFNDAKTRELCLIIGEFGVGHTVAQHKTVKQMYDLAIPNKIGRIYWAWEEGLPLTTIGDGSGWTIDRTDGIKPTNLTWVGGLVWDDNHNALYAPVQDFDNNIPLIINGNFEDDLTGWLNWGGTGTSVVNNKDIEETSGEDTKVLRIALGTAGGIGQTLALDPNTTYRFSVWAKGVGDVGIKYRLETTDEFEFHNELYFSENSWVNKVLTFTTPNEFFGVMHFIWKGDLNSELLVDNIELIKVSVENVDVEALPAKMVYQVGEALDLSGLVLGVHYGEGELDRVTVSSFVAAPNLMYGRNGEGVVVVRGYDFGTEGTKTVTVEYNNWEINFEVQVGNDEKVPVVADSVVLDKSVVVLNVGASVALHAEVLPINAADRSIEWVSDNTSVATVTTEGVVSAIGVGSAVIEVTTRNGLQTSCVVMVKTPEQYTIRYDSNGGIAEKVPIDNQIYAKTDRVTVQSLEELVRVGYAVYGWSTRPDGSGSFCIPDQTFQIEDSGIIDYVVGSELVLYAQWAPTYSP
ncbi:MAG: cellulase family glycosylhydrolase [Nitrososphaerota archaeon]|jgi:hypothetical protein|nr:cellulase family glycosylhydrolase [Nitrososphaerota archaeon]